MEALQPPVDETIKTLLNSKLNALEKYLEADVFFYYGSLQESYDTFFLGLVEQLAKDANKKDILYIILTTSGGSATSVERYVNIVRQHYKEVNFIVPNQAYSAGTIFCMSGDKIFMDYYSTLGPIDPQVFNKENKMVPALGYLDKINELIEKARSGTLTDVEFLILKEYDLGELRLYEQAKELAIDQLEKWLVKYKFKNWNKHKNGKKVTEKEKIKRATEIAGKLSDNNIWKSHSRPINIETLEKKLNLEIEDFGKNKELNFLIRDYSTLIIDFIIQKGFKLFTHTRRFI
jgi:Periplasmic serine proteases (ClpP class)